jgi:predicted kinase
MKSLYLFCGLAFSGKSTLARALVERLGTAYISLDDINHERRLRFGGAGLPVEEWERTHQIALSWMEELMPGGHDIVIDDTSDLCRLRDRFRRMAERYGYQTVIVYLDVPLTEIHERMCRNQETNRRPSAKEQICEALVRNFEPPDADEDVLVYHGAEPVLDWLKRHFPTH